MLNENEVLYYKREEEIEQQLKSLLMFGEITILVLLIGEVEVNKKIICTTSYDRYIIR